MPQRWLDGSRPRISRPTTVGWRRTAIEPPWLPPFVTTAKSPFVGLTHSRRTLLPEPRAHEWLYALSGRMRLVLGDQDWILGPSPLAPPMIGRTSSWLAPEQV